MEPPTLPESVSLKNGLLSSTLGFLRSTFYRVLLIACHIISFPCVEPSKGFPVYSELKLLTMTFKTPHEFPWLFLSLLFSCHWVSCSSNSGPLAVPYIFSKLPLPQCSKCYSLCLEYSSLSFLPIISSPPFSSVQFISVAQSCRALCDSMNRSTPGLPVHHQLPEFTQTHVHRVCDAIQPSHPLLSSSSPSHNPSQHQGLFQWVNSSREVAKILEFQL